MDTITHPCRVATLLPVSAVHEYWPRILAYLNQYPDGWMRTQTPESIYYSLVHGHWQLWTLTADVELICLLFTEHYRYPATTALRVLWCVGKDPTAIVDAHDALEQYARQNALVWVEFTGRIGWKRLVEKIGYEMTGAVFAKDVRQVRMPSYV